MLDKQLTHVPNEQSLPQTQQRAQNREQRSETGRVYAIKSCEPGNEARGTARMYYYAGAGCSTQALAPGPRVAWTGRLRRLTELKRPGPGPKAKSLATELD